MSNAAVINATNASGWTVGSPITIETGGDVVLKAYGTGSGSWSVTLAFAPVVGGVTGSPTTLTIGPNAPSAKTSVTKSDATQWVGWVSQAEGTWEASGLVEGYTDDEALANDIGYFASTANLPTKALKLGAKATLPSGPVTWRGAGSGGWSGKSSVQRLKDHFAKQLISFPDTMATPPTITAGSASSGPAVATVRIIPWDGNTPQTKTIFNSPYIKVFNAPKITGSELSTTQVTMSSQEKFLMAAPKFPSNSGGLGGMCIGFVFDGSDIEILSYGSISIFGTVNGKLISTTKQSSGSASTAQWNRIAFGSRAIREVQLYVNGLIGSIAVGANDTIFPLNLSTPSVVIHGDSFFTTTGPSVPFGGPGGHAVALSSIPYVWGTGWGGSSYYTAGASANANTAFPELANVESCDLWHCSLGINEDRAAVGPENFDSAVYTYYSRVREAFPDAIISTTGPWCPKESVALGARGVVTTDAIKAQLERIPGPWIFLDNTRGTWSNSSGASGSQKVASTSSVTSVNGGPSVNTGAQSPVQSGAWQTGEGKIGATTGKGNGDLNTSADGTHPTTDGVAYLGYKIACGWRDAIMAL